MDYNENNKIIADFMALPTAYKDVQIWMWNSTLPKEDKQDYFLDRELKYHLSWSWLMPVVEKINSFHVSKRPFKFGKPEAVALKILEDRATIQGMFWTNPDTKDGNYWDILKKKKFLYEKHTYIGAVYLAVLEFINWHNQH